MSDIKNGKYLAYLLRHHPEDANLNMDKKGWVDIDKLISNTEGKFTRESLDRIVKNDEKNRYSFNSDKTKIRANQGHSINVDVELKEATPPEILYHGTAKRFIDNIFKEGIKSQTRQHVHLSSEIPTAIMVGLRHGDAVVLKINTKKMMEDGIKFYLSENGVWLTDFIDIKYIIMEPYIHVIKKDKSKRHTNPLYYNPLYGDDKLCVCGHSYYRHFDSYENMYPIGCKYCGCGLFKAKE